MIAALPNFLLCPVTSIAVLLASLAIYTLVLPMREWALTRAGITIAATARLDEARELLFRLRAVDPAELVAGIDTALPLSKVGPAAGKLLASDDISALFGLDIAAVEVTQVPAEPRPGTRKPKAKAVRRTPVAP
jgi:hypothetical protein